MASSSKGIASVENSGLSLSGRVPVRRRGFPNVCRCGEEVVIRTSGTDKNPGRLFHACPLGSEKDKYHLFKWTDLSMVEEIEDIKKKLEILEVDRRSSAEVVNGFEKEIENMNGIFSGIEKEMDARKVEVEECEKEVKEIVGAIRFFKKLICCLWA